MGNDGEPDQETTFEQDLENLEHAVSLLERGDLELEEAIRCYESGHESLKRCYQILERARKRIEILTGAGDLSTPGRGEGGTSGSVEGKSQPEWIPVSFPTATPDAPSSPGEAEATR